MGAEGHIPQAGPTVVFTDEMAEEKLAIFKRYRQLGRGIPRIAPAPPKPRFTYERISQRTYMVTDPKGRSLGMLTQLPGGDWMAGGESLGRDRRRAARVLEKAAAKARIRAAKEERR